MEQIASTILKFSSFPPVILTAYALSVFRKLPAELKTFSLFIFLSGLTEIVSKILWLNSKNNLPLLHLYVACGFFLIAMFYRKVLHGFIDSTILWGIIVSFLAFTIINSIFIQTVFTFNSYALTVEAILIAIFSLSTYMLMLNDIVRKKNLHLVKSINWINSGLFIYYISNLIIFYFGDIIGRTLPRLFNLQTWVLHAFFSAIMYCCFFMGLWNRPRN